MSIALAVPTYNQAGLLRGFLETWLRSGSDLVPLIVVGLLATGFCLWLNWERAPHAEGIKKNAMNQIKRGKKAGEAEPVMAHLFRDRQNDRTWYVRRLRPGTNRLDGVHVLQQDSTGRILKKWYASSALYDAEKKEWKLEKGMIVDFTPEGDINQKQFYVAQVKMEPDGANGQFVFIK